ncbi:MAG: hypothetical protein ABRQ25_15135 [Clostridiaceae bacterium]
MIVVVLGVYIFVILLFLSFCKAASRSERYYDYFEEKNNNE